jgi:hypothetical protein
MKFRSAVRCSFGAIFLLSAHLANAQIAGQGPALPPAAIADFLANPTQLLNQFPNGGPGLAKQIGDLVDSDKATLATLIAIAKTANEDQRKTMASALAQVAKAYAASGDPAFANQIQQAVANSGLPEFAKAYAEAAGDTGTASTGGGGGGGGGPIAGGPTGGQNTGTTPGTTGTNNVTTGLIGSSGVSGGGFSQSTTTTTITQTSPN